MRTGLIVEVVQLKAWEKEGGKPVDGFHSLEVLMPHKGRYTFVVDAGHTGYDIQVGDYLRFTKYRTYYGAWRPLGLEISYEPLELVEGPVRSRV